MDKGKENYRIDNSYMLNKHTNVLVHQAQQKRSEPKFTRHECIKQVTKEMIYFSNAFQR